MASIKLDARVFHRRVRVILSTWRRESSSPEWSGIDSVLVVTGKNDEDTMYSRPTSIQQWLLGYEFPDTIMLITSEKVVFVISKGRVQYIESLRSASDSVKQVPIEIYGREKDGSKDKEILAALLKELKEAKNGKRVGTFPKETPKGKLVEAWMSFFSASTEFSTVEQVDITHGISMAMAVKDDDEVKRTKVASRISALLMKDYVSETVMKIIDEGLKVSHEKIADMIEAVVSNEKERKKFTKFPADTDFDLIETAYTPIVQSGGAYDLKVSAQSNENNLQEGVILCSLGIRYAFYCCNVGRTFLVDPVKDQERTYKFLLKLYDHVISSIESGMRKGDIRCKDVYMCAIEYIRKHRPELEKHFPKNIGFGTGVEFRDSTYLLSAKNDRVLQNDMILNLSLGFQNLSCEDKKKRQTTYALLVADTLRLSRDNVDILTDIAPKALTEINYLFEDDAVKEENGRGTDEDDKMDEEQENKKSTGSKQVKQASKPVSPRRTRVLDSKLRSERIGEGEQSKEQKRMEHQKILHEALLKRGLAQYGSGKKVGGEKSAAVWRKFESYKTPNQLPAEVSNMKICVDRRNNTIILPIYGLPVPFHISTLKNVTKSDEGRVIHLRFNFWSPGQSTGRKDASTMPFEDPNATFIRSIAYRSEDPKFVDIFTAVTNLRKEFTKKEDERREMADLVEQDKLVEIRGKRPLRLQEVAVRPNVDTKRVRADLEIHVNGIRYQSSHKTDIKIDILFSNIRHLFFQPCDGEESVILHVHLNHPIMLGKKKTKDIQFFRDVNEQGYDETSGRRRKFNYGDEDELMAEQEERRRRAQFNKEFKSFAEKISEASDGKLEVDIPYRELGFNGVPHRELTLLMPTTSCLVGLTDRPPIVITLEDLEKVHLERVQHGLKNFDVVFVYKDFSRAPTMIKTVPMNSLESVKEWLDSMDIPFSEGPITLNWVQIMKTVNEDPGAFFREGGWKFLELDDDDGDDYSESASEFEMDESDFDDEESTEYSDESDEDEEESDYSGSDSGSGDSEEESGEDWDELERKAAEHDAKKRKAGEEEVGKKKKMRR